MLGPKRPSSTNAKGEMKLKKKIASLAILAMSLFLWMSVLALNIQQIRAGPGDYLVTVRYIDGTPRPEAGVFVKTPQTYLGKTNGTGQISGTLPDGGYTIWAMYPLGGSQFGTDVFLPVPGSATITADYEITPPNITIISPQNTTYSTTSIDLNCSIYDFSDIVWTGYSLDGKANVTSGNTTLTGLGLGPHNVIVYANDTFGNMGNSSKVYFTIAVHDVAIVDINISEQRVVQQPIHINVTVTNNGGFEETFDVSCNYTLRIDPLIGTQTITLEPGESIILNFTWTPSATGQYEIKAYTSTIANDVNPSDNTKITYIYVSSGLMATWETTDIQGSSGGHEPWLTIIQ